MDKDKNIEYLKELNKELVRELTRFDKLTTQLNAKLSKQQNTITLLNKLQQSFAESGTDEDFFKNTARLISEYLEMSATYILLPDVKNPTHFKILNTEGLFDTFDEIPVLSLPELDGLEKYILINSKSKDTQKARALKEKLGFISLIIYPVKYDGDIKLIIVAGINLIDNAMALDLNEEDINTIEAVSILLSSFIRKTEVIKLNELDKIKTDFVSNISHEFRTPLTLVLGLLDELKHSRIFYDDDSDKIDIVLKNAFRLKQLIDQLLDISKLETETEKLHVSENSLSDLFLSISKTFSEIAKKNHIRFQYSINSTNESTWFDEDKAEKILTNLLSNAFKYTNKNGQVIFEIDTEISDNGLYGIFQVRDTGIGIAEAEQEKIFDRFYRAEQSDQKKEGTGIGLYLAKKLTELHHGTLTLKSKLNDGTAFTVKLPLSREAFNEREIRLNQDEIVNYTVDKEKEEAFKNDQVEKPLLLIVEDNEDLNTYISTNLKLHFRILKAYNGEEGFQLALNHIPDLIVTDVMMPVCDGNEMSQNIRKNDITKHIPIIMLTAKADRDSKLTGLIDGAGDYITKPFDMQELLLKITNRIERTNTLREKIKKEFISDPDDSTLNLPQDNLLRDILKLLNKNLDNTEFRVDEMCRELFVSRTQLFRKIESLTGYSPAELLRIMRLKAAARLFKRGHQNVSDVMFAVGFNSQSNFSKNFKKIYGSSPSEYINNCRIN